MRLSYPVRVQDLIWCQLLVYLYRQNSLQSAEDTALGSVGLSSTCHPGRLGGGNFLPRGVCCDLQQKQWDIGNGADGYDRGEQSD